MTSRTKWAGITGEGRERPAARHPRVVHEEVDPSVLRDGPLDEGAARLGIRDVRGLGDGRPPGLAAEARDVFQRRGVPGGEDEPASPRRQLERQGAAYSLGRSRENDGTSREIAHRILLRRHATVGV